MVTQNPSLIWGRWVRVYVTFYVMANVWLICPPICLAVILGSTNCHIQLMLRGLVWSISAHFNFCKLKCPIKRFSLLMREVVCRSPPVMAPGSAQRSCVHIFSLAADRKISIMAYSDPWNGSCERHWCTHISWGIIDSIMP